MDGSNDALESPSRALLSTLESDSIQSPTSKQETANMHGEDTLGEHMPTSTKHLFALLFGYGILSCLFSEIYGMDGGLLSISLLIG